MNSTLTSISSSQAKIQRIIATKFDVHLTADQLMALIEKQPEVLQQALRTDSVGLAVLDHLVETISEEITGIQYPTEASTPYYKEYFKKKLQENKARYFGLGE